jgi:hypothetical protein
MVKGMEQRADRMGLRVKSYSGESKGIANLAFRISNLRINIRKAFGQQCHETWRTLKLLKKSAEARRARN